MRSELALNPGWQALLRELRTDASGKEWTQAPASAQRQVVLTWLEAAP